MVDYRSQSYAKYSSSSGKTTKSSSSSSSNDSNTSKKRSSSSSRSRSSSSSNSFKAVDTSQGQTTQEGYTDSSGNVIATKEEIQQGLAEGKSPEQIKSEAVKQENKRRSSGGGSSSKQSVQPKNNPNVPKPTDPSTPASVNPETSSSKPYMTIKDSRGNVKQTFDSREDYRAYQAREAAKVAIRKGTPYIQVGGRYVNLKTANTKAEKEAAQQAKTNYDITQIRKYAEKRGIKPQTKTEIRDGTKYTYEIYEEDGKQLAQITYSQKIQQSQPVYYTYDREKKQTRPAKLGEVIKKENPMSQESFVAKQQVEIELGLRKPKTSIKNPTGKTESIKDPNRFGATQINAVEKKGSIRNAWSTAMGNLDTFAAQLLTKGRARSLDEIGQEGINFRNFKAPGASMTFGEFVDTKKNQANSWLDKTTQDLFSLSPTPNLNAGPNNKNPKSYSQTPKQNMINQNQSSSQPKGNDSLFNNVLRKEFEIGQKLGKKAKESYEFAQNIPGTQAYQDLRIKKAMIFGAAAGASAIASARSAIVDNPVKTTVNVVAYLLGLGAASKVTNVAATAVTGSAKIGQIAGNVAPFVIETGRTALEVSAGETRQEKAKILAQNIAVDAAFIGTIKTIDKVSDATRRVGKIYVEPEYLYSKQVLEDGQRFPTGTPQQTKKITENTQKTSLFEDTITVQTNAPRPISGDAAGAGPAGAKNLEDAGIYTTPAPEGSPYFLGTSGEGMQKQWKAWPEFNRPTTTIITNIKKVETIPKKVLDEPGFETSNEYLKSRAGDRTAFVTKRSTKGQTSEIEMVIPEGSKFIDKYDKPLFYTKYNGRTVEVRTLSLVDGASKPTNTISNADIRQSDYELSRSINTESRTLSPLSSSYINQSTSVSSGTSSSPTSSSTKPSPSESNILESSSSSLSSPSSSITTSLDSTSSSSTRSSSITSVSSGSSTLFSSSSSSTSSSSFTPYGSSSSYYRRSYSSRNSFVPILRPNLDKNTQKIENPLKKKKRSFKGLYQPSVAAAALRITGEKNLTGAKTGFGFRPIDKNLFKRGKIL